ncbi:MAG: hypothetical protein QM571_06395 [Micrococcaceae bacterium]
MSKKKQKVIQSVEPYVASSAKENPTSLYNILRRYAMKLSTYYMDVARKQRKGKDAWEYEEDKRLWEDVHKVDRNNIYQISKVMNQVINKMREVELRIA